jgi:hypothetical protein
MLRRKLTLTLIAALPLGCSCSDDEERPPSAAPDAGADARRDADRLDTGPDQQVIDAAAEADARPAEPTRGSCGDTAWSKRFGASPAGDALADEQAFAVTTTLTGDLVATGWYKGDADFGGGLRAAGADNTSMFVARFGADGSHVWSRGFGDPTQGLLFAPQARGRAVAMGDDESVLIGGQFAGQVDFGKGPITSRETPLDADAGLDAGTDAGLGFCFTCIPDAVVMKLDSAGTTQWVRHFGSDGTDLTRAVAQAPNNAIAAGTVEGSVDFGGGITTTNGHGDAFVLALDGDGKYQWARRFAGSGEDDAFGVAIDPTGGILVAGSFTETMTIGAKTLSSPGHASGFLALLDPSGNPVWAKEFVATQLALATAVAVDVSGDIVVVGAFRGTMKLDRTDLVSAYNDAFVVKYDGAGNQVFGAKLGGAQNDEANAVAVDGNGRVFVAGGVGSDNVDFGGGPIRGGRSDDLFLVTLTPMGEHICSRRYGNANGASSALGLALDQGGNALVAGAFSGTVDFGAGALGSTGGNDILLARFDDIGAR